MIGWLDSLTDADTYLGAGLSSGAWSALSDSEKTAYLTAAYRMLVSNPDYAFPDSADQAMLDAQCEMAAALMSDPTFSDRQSLINQGVRSFTIGKFSETLSSSSAAGRSGTMRYPAIVEQLLYGYLSDIDLTGTDLDRTMA